jgi:hypothetical protein
MKLAGRLCAVLLWGVPVVAPFDATSQSNQIPRLIPAQVARPTAEQSQDLEARFLANEEWTFYHRVSDVPDQMRQVLFKLASPAIVDTGESFDAGDSVHFGSSSQHLFSAFSKNNDIGVMVWYSGGFNGLVLRALIYAPAVGDGFEYGFANPMGGISLQPALKSMIREPSLGFTRRYRSVAELR